MSYALSVFGPVIIIIGIVVFGFILFLWLLPMILGLGETVCTTGTNPEGKDVEICNRYPYMERTK